MHKIFMALAVAALATPPAWSQAQHSSGGTEQAVAALELTWLKSHQTNDADLAAPLMADNILLTDAGKLYLGKAAVLARQKSIKWSSAEYRDMKVTVFGNTAIATGEFKGNGTDETGKPFDYKARWTDTWVKTPGGRWQCVASQE
jgi:ketosteroid isomerase-like protein